MRVAIIHEWLASYAGSEKVVEQILSLYPDADLFSLVDFLPTELRHFIHHKSVQTSFIQTLPFAKKHFRQYLPLMPLAIERFDLSGYDLIVSSHHAVAKGVLNRADQLHISYVHTPIRYAWDLQAQYLQETGLNQGLKGLLVQLVLHYLRLWDVNSANRVDAFLANSAHVARRIWKTYRRQAQVIYPPVEIQRFHPQIQRDNFYFTLSRFVPYKRVDLIVAAFTQLALPLVVMGDGPDLQRIQALAGPHVQLLKPQSNAVVEDYMQRCKAFVFAAEEDFGISLVEAQAAGAPVIAYGQGGAAEIVIHGKTGLLFREQTVESLMETIGIFESNAYHFSLNDISQNAERFSQACFRQRFITFVNQTWTDFDRGNGIEY
ncbi:MAG: glycosyltransferase family 4 protein [Cyanothece sp. SIO1E1]|nr:glycosyltransferase family 4 protein [Cyanothece sp. SIO1E1]